MTKFLVRSGLILMATLLLLSLAPTPTQQPVVIHTQREKATKNEKLHNATLIISYADAGYGWTGRESVCLLALWTRESRLDHYAVPRFSNGKPRSTAYGIAQLLGEKSSDPSIQILRGLRYVQHRYNTPCRANKHSLRYGWY